METRNLRNGRLASTSRGNKFLILQFCCVTSLFLRARLKYLQREPSLLRTFLPRNLINWLLLIRLQLQSVKPRRQDLLGSEIRAVCHERKPMSFLVPPVLFFRCSSGMKVLSFLSYLGLQERKDRTKIQRNVPPKKLFRLTILRLGKGVERFKEREKREPR